MSSGHDEKTNGIQTGTWAHTLCCQLSEVSYSRNWLGYYSRYILWFLKSLNSRSVQTRSKVIYKKPLSQKSTACIYSCLDISAGAEIFNSSSFLRQSFTSFCLTLSSWGVCPWLRTQERRLSCVSSHFIHRVMTLPGPVPPHLMAHMQAQTKLSTSSW